MRTFVRTLDDFLVPDDEEEEDADDDSGDGDDDGDDARGRHGEVQRARGRMWRKKEERGLVVSPRKVRRVVDSDSASSGVDPGGGGGRPSSEVSSESEEWDEGLGGQSSKEARAERALRERKSLRDMHGGLSPLQRIRSAQQRALGVGVGGEAAGQMHRSCCRPEGPKSLVSALQSVPPPSPPRTHAARPE